MPFTLKQFEIGPMQNFGYLIADDKSKMVLIVDPAWSPKKLQTLVSENGYTLAGLVITHAHYDHVNAIEELLKTFDVPVYANKAEISYAKSGTSIVGDLGATVKPMNGGDVIEIGETDVELLHTPGHTPGSQCVRVGNNLITGDTLFIDGCGRSDLPGGDPATLFQSLRKIAGLPPTLEIFPGHDYGPVRRRNLGEETKSNPYLRMTDEKIFVNAVS